MLTSITSKNTISRLSLSLLASLLVLLCPLAAGAKDPQPRTKSYTILPDSVVAALSQELSGETAKRNIEYITRLHRMRGSSQYRTAAEYVMQQLRDYGLEEVELEELPVDGVRYYGTQRSRPAWDAEFAELWELRKTSGDGWEKSIRLASWDAMPLTLAQDSESADVTADVIDVGAGTNDADYTGKDVRGKLVLASEQPGLVAQIAVAKLGAVGVLSYAQNQRTAWSGENGNLIRWGHLDMLRDSFTPVRTFAFMLSLNQARALQARLAGGEHIRMHAVVRAGRHAGNYYIATAALPGGDPKLAGEEILFGCHLDHPRPGANDNASGCVATMEIARTLSVLIKQGRLPRPARTLRFIYPPEIEGVLTLLVARPEYARRTKAVVLLDMVGGGPDTKAILRVTRNPASLPSFVSDVAEHFAEFVNDQTVRYATTGVAEFPLVAQEGGKEPLQAMLTEYEGYEVYTEGSFRIPTIYLHDSPDRYIHTNWDTADKIDATKLRRTAFIGVASGYFLASMKPDDARAVIDLLKTQSLRRAAVMVERRSELPREEADNLTRFQLAYERGLVDSLDRFVVTPAESKAQAAQHLRLLASLLGSPGEPRAARGPGAAVYSRVPELKGPMAVFQYDYFVDKYGPERAKQIALLSYRGLRGGGSEYAYEALNFVDGTRTAQQIRGALAAIYGPIPLEHVTEYLAALESIGVVRRR